MKNFVIITLLLFTLLNSCNLNVDEHKTVQKISNINLDGKEKMIDSLKSLSIDAAIKGDFKLTKELSEKIHELDSTDAYSLSRLGFFYFLNGENDKALAFINRSIQYDHMKEFTHNIAFKASIFHELKKEDSADYYFKKMPTYNKDGASDFWQILMAFNMSFKFDKVIEYNKLTLKYYPEDPFAKVNEANLIAKEKRYDKAMLIYNQISEEKRSAYFYSSRGACYSYLKDYNNALRDMQKALEMEPNNTHYITGVARINEKMRNYIEAEKFYKIAISGGDTMALRLYNSLLSEKNKTP